MEESPRVRSPRRREFRENCFADAQFSLPPSASATDFGLIGGFIAVELDCTNAITDNDGFNLNVTSYRIGHSRSSAAPRKPAVRLTCARPHLRLNGSA